MNKIKIKKGNIYKIPNSPSLNKKYNQGQILIQIEDRDKVVFGDTWNNRQNIPAVVAFMFRQIDDSIFDKEREKVYYGKILQKKNRGGKEQFVPTLGELVFESELEKYK